MCVVTRERLPVKKQSAPQDQYRLVDQDQYRLAEKINIARSARSISLGRPSGLDPYSGPTLLTHIWSRFWTWSLTSSMLCSSSVCLPSTPPAPPFRSSLAPPDARRAAPLGSLPPPRPKADHVAEGKTVCTGSHEPLAAAIRKHFSSA
jgi:hypothetical protein